MIDEIIDKLSNDELVVYPTDTIYGIASNINSLKAIDKVFQIKNRSYDKPLSVCVHDFRQLDEVACVNSIQRRIAKLLFPGTYTLLFKKREDVSDLLTANSDVIGVRIPDNEISSALTRSFPITTTSANLSNTTTPDNVCDIIKQLGSEVSFYIDGGRLSDNTYSTIINLTGKRPSILRRGMCEEEKIRKILKMNLYDDE